MKKMLIYTLIVAVAVVFSSVMYAAVVTSAHDFSVSSGPGTIVDSNVDYVCVFCHTPHQSGTTVDPLWNHTLSATASYGVYDSTTFDGAATIADIGGGTSVSNLCMSCHDGTVAVGSLYNDPNAFAAPDAVAIPGGSTAMLGTDLTNDHPVNFDYDAAQLLDSELVASAGGMVGGVAPLFGTTMQCASCHDPHGVTGVDTFLLIDNTGSALCLTCHVK